MILTGLFAGLVLASCKQPKPPEPPNVIKALDFEDGDLSGWSRMKLVGEHSAKVVESPIRGGDYAVRFMLRKDDKIVSKSKRAELELKHHADIGGEYWYGFSIYIPADWQYDTINEVVTQWNATRDKEIKENAKRSPPLALRIKKDHWYITMRWDKRRLTPPGNKAPKLRLWKGPYKKGAWTDWVVHAKWSFEKDGLVRVWQNGKLIIEHAGPNCYNDKRGLRFKIGLYKPKWQGDKYTSLIKERIIYHDEIRVGNKDAKYADVAPRTLQER